MPSQILAVITMKKENIAGGAPIFIEPSKERLQQTAFTLEKILDAMVHEISEDTLIIVRHK
ncbi:capping complex subunit for YIEGIA [Brevibacillus sp. NRS-1366]|uniref:capping complex subunit for YIEGIA n=1 Tax=Brevibacillus sp. NRS-1366 TaxID=3233899 RepID=UPI003D1F28D3